ncbi:hypothetical protein COJ46_15725 [Bacillus sp. AFS077874]|uniref:glycosyltransferase family 4 protein n=1 Tax=Bacillus sp. AFS077874 TaxID=2033513 RepID=UPI000BFA0D14|nr:glycosyltransferase family 4 protein [Bacillus sp. AFS077874]PFM78974.1 hypothetical protein COJ46_15725 [Bacillus sp. AFS077874]
MKRITCVIDKVGGTGGAERVMTTLCNDFSKLGISVTLIVRENMQTAYPLNKKVHMVSTPVKLRNPFIRNFMRNIKLRKEIKKSNPDVIISFIAGMNLQVLLFTFGLKYPVVISERNDPKKNSKLEKILIKILYPRAKGYVFQTEDAKREFSKKIQKLSTVIANPLPEDLPLRTDINLNEIVSVGRLEIQKNQELLLRAFKKFKKKYVDYTLKIYGKGSMQDKLQEQIDYLGLRDSVTLMGSVPMVTEKIRNAEMFILSSDFEGMPNALAEAMAMGIPSISSDCPCGGPGFLIDNGINGLLFPVQDEEALLEAMVRLAENKEFAISLGENSKMLREQLKSSEITSQWIQYCKKVI